MCSSSQKFQSFKSYWLLGDSPLCSWEEIVILSGHLAPLSWVLEIFHCMGQGLLTRRARGPSFPASLETRNQPDPHSCQSAAPYQTETEFMKRRNRPHAIHSARVAATGDSATECRAQCQCSHGGVGREAVAVHSAYACSPVWFLWPWSWLVWFSSSPGNSVSYLMFSKFWSSLYDPWTSSTGITWELIKNADSWALPQTYWDSVYFNKIPSGLVLD